MTGQASFANKGAGPEHADDPFLPLLGDHAEFDLAILYVEDRVALGALLEDVALCLVRERVRPAPMVVRKASVSKASLFAALLPVLPLAMVLPTFLILAFVIRVVALDLSLAGTQVLLRR